MSDLSQAEVQEGNFGERLSWFDRTALSALRLIPGFGRGSSRALLALRGSAWTMAGFGASQLLRLATQLVLARKLLGPQAFGLVALVSVFLSGLELLSDLGIGMDVIQDPRGDDPVFINTAFLIQGVRGIILFGIAAALAYPFARFYHQPTVHWMIVVAALSVGLRGLSSGSIWTLTRRVQIGKLTALNVGGDSVGFAVSVAWALVSPTAWALVVGRVASSAVYVILSHVISENPVTLDWDRNAARDILLFGSGIFLSSATYFLSAEAERLIVGKFITIAELGCFSLALALASAPSQAISRVVGQVFFPMISASVREDQATATKHYRKARFAFLALGMALGVVLIAYGPRLVALLLPPKYAMTGWMLQLLGFRAAQEVFAAPTTSLIFAYGDSKHSAVANAVRMVLMFGGILIAFTKFGTRQAVEVLAFVPVISYFVLIHGISRHLRRALNSELLAFGLFCTAMMVAAILPWPWA